MERSGIDVANALLPFPSNERAKDLGDLAVHLLAQRAAALAACSNTHAPFYRRVRVERRLLKELRAVLDLARVGGDTRRLDGARQSLKESGALLAPAREADAIVFTLDAIEKRAASKHAARDPPRDVAATRKVAQAERDAAERALHEVPSAVGDDDGIAVDELVGALPRDFDEQRAQDGIRRAFRRAAKQLSAAERAPTSENLHELRKRAKVTRAHVAMLRGEERKWKKVSASLDRVNELLGDAHDLDVLVHWLESKAALPQLRAFAAARRDRLGRRALKEARKVFDAKARRFAKSLLQQVA